MMVRTQDNTAMECPICVTCGTQYPAAAAEPARCPICEDARQYVPVTGQRWTTLPALRATHNNVFRRYEEGLYAIGTQPAFAIGQRAWLLRTPHGNVLWDCIALLDDATLDIVRAFGGISAIAISHPHYYTTMVEWANAFDAPLWLHAADRDWVMRDDTAIRHWSGDTHSLLDGVTLVRAGGHFPGGAVLHWRDGRDGRGALLSGDVLQVVPDRKHVSFMWSYPNYVPLPAAQVRAIAARVEPFDYDAVYGAFWNAEIVGDGKAAVAASARRYIAMLERGPLG